jgi:hypothetical protein
MDTKLTLKLNKEVIEKAKEFARIHKVSLSRMIESYLYSLVNKEDPVLEKDFEISPFVKSMQTGVKIPADYDYKKAYGDHLEKKYQ